VELLPPDRSIETANCNLPVFGYQVWLAVRLREKVLRLAQRMVRAADGVSLSARFFSLTLSTKDLNSRRR
jgi:hypothetical protein